VPAYLRAVAPLVSLMPASMVYSAALAYGDASYILDGLQRDEISTCVDRLLGPGMNPRTRKRVVRNIFRMNACRNIDPMLFSGSGDAIMRLVRVRGLEHVATALASGRGALLCGAHYGGAKTCVGILGLLGLPVSSVTSWSFYPEQFKQEEEQPFYRVMQRPMAKHVLRPNIRVITYDRNIEVAVKILSALRRNELVYTILDVEPEIPNQKKGVVMDFLGGHALLQPGALRIAKMAGSPVLTMLLHRSADGRHLTLELSPPMEVTDEISAFRSCLNLIEATIRSDPAPWELWRMRRLVQFGLFPEEEANRFFSGKRHGDKIRERTGPVP
jgi:lauroyl/myristoyl acyltransferase